MTRIIHERTHLREKRPTFIVVEPQAAACLLESATRFAPARIEGELRTQMQMLAVGEASPAAWPVLQRRVDAFMAIGDAPAVKMAARLNRPESDRAALNSDTSGAAGLAGMCELAGRAELAGLLKLDADARVLAFGTQAAQPQ